MITFFDQTIVGSMLQSKDSRAWLMSLMIDVLGDGVVVANGTTEANAAVLARMNLLTALRNTLQSNPDNRRLYRLAADERLELEKEPKNV